MARSIGSSRFREGLGSLLVDLATLRVSYSPAATSMRLINSESRFKVIHQQSMMAKACWPPPAPCSSGAFPVAFRGPLANQNKAQIETPLPFCFVSFETTLFNSGEFQWYFPVVRANQRRERIDFIYDHFHEIFRLRALCSTGAFTISCQTELLLSALFFPFIVSMLNFEWYVSDKHTVWWSLMFYLTNRILFIFLIIILGLIVLFFYHISICV